jgi:NAD+ synthase (glutamine-hydrolysing)
VYAAAGEGESTTDLSWDGQTMIYENGVLLAETERFPDGPRRSVADVDLDLLRPSGCGWAPSTTTAARMRPAPMRSAPSRSRSHPPATDLGLRRRVERFPFVPADDARLELDCYEAYNIQVSGLEQRLRSIGNPKIVIGVSGGLDSTHALIVAAKAMDRLGRPRTDILGLHDAGLRDERSHQGQRDDLMRTLGVTAAELDITRHGAADARQRSTTRTPTASRSTT